MSDIANFLLNPTNRRQRWLRDATLRQDWHCHWCHRRMNLSREGFAPKAHAGTLPPWWPTLDHIISRADGGSDTEENTVACCNRCNSRKGDLMPWEFIPIIAKERDRQQKIIDFDQERKDAVA